MLPSSLHCKHLPHFISNGRRSLFAIGVYFVLSQSITSTGSASSFVKQTKECQSVDEYGQPIGGKCVQFFFCPRLLELVKQPGKTLDEFRLLKSLTCGFRKNEPLVNICCPEREVERPPSRDDSSPRLVMKFPDEMNSNEAYSNRGTLPVPDVEYSSKARRSSLIPAIEDCGEPRFDASTGIRIIGGQAAERGDFPFMALLYRIDTNTDEEEYFCAGTILNQYYILTAAHCILTNKRTSYELAYVQVGITDVKQRCYQSKQEECISMRRYNIIEKIPHPKYVYGSSDRSHDIALLRTSKPIALDEKYIRPVCLPLKQHYGLSLESMVGKTDSEDYTDSSGSNNLTIKGSGLVAGWGRDTSIGGGSSKILKHALLPIISSADCQKLYGSQASISEKMQICAGGEKGKDTCVGDSGGPLLNSFQRSPNSSNPLEKKFVGKMFQTGIVSFGPALCGSSGKPSVYTKVLPYIDWILENMYL